MAVITKIDDKWQTPKPLFEELNKEFTFTHDLCADETNSLCPDWFDDYLIADFKGGVGFCNPPYSYPKPFIEKCWSDSKHCKIVCLVPNTIKTCKYMDILDKNQGTSSFRDWKNGIEIRDLARRTKFTHPSKKESSPSFGCMLIIMDRRGIS